MLFIMLCSVNFASHASEIIQIPDKQTLTKVLEDAGLSDFDKKTHFSNINGNKKRSIAEIISIIDNAIAFLFIKVNYTSLEQEIFREKDITLFEALLHNHPEKELKLQEILELRV